MSQRSKYGLTRRRQAYNAPHYEPPVFTTTTAVILGSVTGLIVVLILIAL